MEWQDFETAPKDGRDILAFTTMGSYIVVWWADDSKCWLDCDSHAGVDSSILDLWIKIPELP